MAFVEVNPRYKDQLNAVGVRSAEQFLSLSGVVISGHPERHVVRVRLGPMCAFLKREHRVRRRDRLTSWLAGFGLVTKSQREAIALQALERAGVGCPEGVAYGEVNRRRAFLLFRELENAVERRDFMHERRGMRERRDLARQIGRDLARLHAEGFNHPDLYAKHVFISAGDQTIYFLDWQRSRHGVISESRRLRDLAALEATLAETL